MKECKIVQDLLPNYIEKLTNQETNEYIKEHLKQCNECSEVLKDMQKDITEDNENQVQKQTNYLKKYNKKLRIFKFLILAVILFFLINTGRKMFIIKSLQEKIAQYKGIDNYHIEHHEYSEGNNYTGGIYQKGEKYMSYGYMANYSKYDKVIYIREEFGDKNHSNMYVRRYDVDDKFSYKKVMQLNNNNPPTFEEFIEGTNFKTKNFGELLLMALTSRISNEKCNDKECYKIDYTVFTGWPPYPIPWQQEHYNLIDYVEKETGLLIRRIGNEGVSITHKEPEQTRDIYYEFGIVTDEDLKEPDISEFENE